MRPAAFFVPRRQNGPSPAVPVVTIPRTRGPLFRRAHASHANRTASTRRAMRTLLVAALLPLLAVVPARRPAQDAPAPISLSDPDGQELVIEELNVRTAVQGVFSLTEMEIVFRNPHARRMEGRFSAVLPEGATVSRFAKEVNGRLMEGEVVERLRANRVYAEILHQMRDPALLEQDQGNRFGARIFPIEANARVRVVLGYTRLLRMENGVRSYRLPLRGLPRIGTMRLTANVQPLPHETLAGATLPEGAREEDGRIAWENESFTPAQDLELRWSPRADAPREYLLKAGDFYVAGVRPDVAPSAPDGPRTNWVFYLDTSASAADGMDHRLAALRDVLAAIPGSRVELVAFDQAVAPLGSFAPREASRRVDGLVRARGFLGGTDLHAVLQDVARRAARTPGTRFVLVSDGAATVGQTSPAEVYRPLERLPSGTRLHALVLGAREDALALGQVTAGRGRIVRIPFTERMTEHAREAAARLALAPGRTMEVRDAAAQTVHAIGAADVQAGGEVLVLGRLNAGAETRLAVGGVRVGTGIPIARDRFEPLLLREFYRAHLDSLQAEERHADGDEGRRRLAEEQVRLSIQHRVMVPRTTMLVLETEADYDRFGLERTALAEILTAGPSGIERLDRASAPALASAADAEDDADTEDADDGDPPADLRAEELAGVGMELGTSEPLPAESVDESLSEASAGFDGAPPPPAPPPPPPPPPPAMAPPPAPALARRPPATGEEMVVTGNVSQQSADSTAAAVAPPAEPPRPRLPDWVGARRFRDGEADSLMAALRADPRDRALYNALSEALTEAGRWAELRTVAFQWQPMDPDNPQVYESIALAAHGLGRADEALRATGSLVEVAPGKPEMLQRAALLLWRVGGRQAWEAPARRAVEMRPDLPNPHRTLALLLWQAGRREEAAEVLERALAMPIDRWYGNAAGVVRDELGYVYRDWMRAEPGRAEEIRRRARERGVDLARTDRLRITMTWDTDGNDVDLHVVDPRGAHVYYGDRTAASGIELLEDITQGFGPEVVRTDRVDAGAYHVGVKYFSAGPMGIARGTLVVMEPEGDGVRVRIEPFRLIPERGDVQQVLTLEPGGPGKRK
jgi:tetratricopeptide (TPR) repeat protein